MNQREEFADEAVLRGIEQSLPLALLKAREVAMSQFRPMLRAHKLTEQQWRVIRVLAAFPNIDASEIVERSYLLAPSLTRILQYLEGQKLVARSADEADLRFAYFRLTNKGEKLFARVAPDSELIYQRISEAYGQQKLDKLYQLLASFSELELDTA
ncbi:MAG: homoprotocatechuate degradation operon regulator HpaR [Pseudomonadota bacterium]